MTDSPSLDSVGFSLVPYRGGSEKRTLYNWFVCFFTVHKILRSLEFRVVWLTSHKWNLHKSHTRSTL